MRKVCSVRWLLWGLCLSLPVAGLVVYLLWPDVPAFLLVSALVGGAFGLGGALAEEFPEKARPPSWLSVHSRSLWAFCIVLAVGGNAVYLLWMNDRTWLIGLLAATPLIVLGTAWVEERRTTTGRGPDQWGGVSDGPWGPP